MRKVGFNKDFEYKNEPDYTTPDEAENANIGIHNTWYLLQQLEDLIDSKTGSNIEITECAEAMLNKLEIEGKSIQESEPSPDNPVEIKCVGKSNEQGKYEIELTISKDDESKTTTFILNEPLRSLPNETKDLLYVKGGRLFVERNTKELVLNGSENWTKDLSNNSYLLQNSSIYGLWATACAYSNRFKYSHTDAYYCRADSFAIDSNHRIIIAIQNISTLEDFKAWLNSNNVIIVAKLVEPVIEDLGEIQIPITFKDKSTITTTDELEPTINLEYVKDTILTDYIEKRLMNLIK